MSFPLRIDFEEKPVRIGIVVLAVAAVATAGATMLRGWHSPAAAAPVVYVCKETGEAFELPHQEVPALNPNTGRRTLYQGVYCSDCNRWYPAPVANHRGGNPKAPTCPIHKTAMTFEGPSIAQTAASATAP